jgi:hypothetical protein
MNNKKTRAFSTLFLGETQNEKPGPPWYYFSYVWDFFSFDFDQKIFRNRLDNLFKRIYGSPSCIPSLRQMEMPKG